MKKLVMVLAAVAMAVSANASTTKWSFTSTLALKDGYTGKATPDLMKGATMYFFSTADVTQSALLTDLRAGKSISGFLFSGTTDSAGKITAAAGVGGSIDDKFTAGKAYDFYSAVVVDGYVYLSASKNATAGTNPDVAVTVSPSASASKTLVDSTGKAAFGDAGWYSTASVPEPTSGLLLLLGMAGLALRRHRA